MKNWKTAGPNTINKNLLKYKGPVESKIKTSFKGITNTEKNQTNGKQRK